MSTESTPSVRGTYVTTPQLLAAHARSLEAGQNRLLTDEFLDSLDPRGIHIVNFAMEHENYEGTRGIRTELLCKTRHMSELVSVFFDFMVEDFMNLLLRSANRKQAA